MSAPKPGPVPELTVKAAGAMVRKAERAIEHEILQLAAAGIPVTHIAIEKVGEEPGHFMLTLHCEIAGVEPE